MLNNKALCLVLAIYFFMCHYFSVVAQNNDREYSQPNCTGNTIDLFNVHSQFKNSTEEIGGYAFFDNNSVVLKAGSTVKITLKADYKIKAWVDWNHDKNFTESMEMEVIKNPIFGFYNIFLKVPANYQTGTTRIRICSSISDSLEPNSVPLPFSARTEIQDYNLIITDPNSPAPNTFRWFNRANNSNWHYDKNWIPRGIPSENDIVIITNNNYNRFPNIVNDNISVYQLQIKSGGKLTLCDNSSLNIKDNLVIKGDLEYKIDLST